MAMRAGWKIDGKHFRETVTTRMYSRRVMYFIDGKPVSRKEFFAEYNAAKARGAERDVGRDA